MITESNVKPMVLKKKLINTEQHNSAQPVKAYHSTLSQVIDI